MSAPPPHGSRERAIPQREPAPSTSLLGLSRFAWLVIAIAFAVGLLLFLMLWLDQRNDNDFYRSDSAAPTSTGQVFEPLPAPSPAGSTDDSASGMDRDDTGRAPQIAEESTAPAAPPPEQPTPRLSPAETAIAAGEIPVPIDSPSPSYPPAALRRGESGTVLLRVHVSPDGVTDAVDLVDSSRSRLLDRAAIDAVKRWRFRPAQRNGQAVAGQVQVPIAFNAGG